MAIKVQDTFTDSDGVDLAAHTPDTDVVGGGWTDSGTNDLEILSNEVQASANTDESHINGGVADCLVSVDFNAGGADNRMGVEARHDGSVPASRDGYLVNFRPGIDEIIIYRKDNGGSTQLGSTISFTASTSTTYKVSIKANGSTISALIDDDNKGNRTDSTYLSNTRGAIAHFLFTDAAARFDNFLFEDLAAGTVPQNPLSKPLARPLAGPLQ